MARPQIQTGFVQIALDLFPAIMAADLSNREMIVLAEILLQCYGPAKRPTAVIDPVEVERLTGLHRNNVRRALAGLQAAGMIATTPDGSIDFIKDWETWKPKGESLIERLGGGIKRFALSALSRFGRKHTSRNGTIQEDSISTSTPIQVDSVTTVKPNPPGFCDSRKTDSKRIGTKVDASKNTSSHAPELPTTYGESLAGAGARASEELEIKHSEGAHGGFRLIEVETADGSTVPFVGDLSPSQAELDRAFKVAEGLFPNSGFGLKAQQFATSYPVAWIVQALEAAAASEAVDIGWSYIWKILRRYAANGGPDQVKASGGHGGGRRGLSRNEPALPPVVDPGLVRKRSRGSNPPTHHAKGINPGWREVRA